MTGARPSLGPARSPAWAEVRTAWPYLMVAVSFVVSRWVYRALGVRFDFSPVYYYIQYLDPWFFEHDFARSLLYLHHQAPLLNLLVGVAWRIFGPTWAFSVLEALYVALGLGVVVGILRAMLRLGARPTIAAVLVSLYAAAPSTVINESWLFYHPPVTLCLTLSLLALLRFQSDHTLRSGVLFFSLLAVAALFRSILGPSFVLAIVALLLLRPPLAANRRAWRLTVGKAAVVPLLVLALNSAKSSLLMGVGYGEGAFWGNIATRTFNELGPAERQRLLSDGTISPVVTTFCLLDLRMFEGFRVPHAPTGVPLLDLERTPNGRWNAHALEYVLMARKYYKPAGIFLVSHYPDAYAKSVVHALSQYFALPTTDSILPYTENHRRLRGIIDRLNDLGIRGPEDRLLVLLILLPALVAYAIFRMVGARGRRGSERALATALAYMLFNIFYGVAVTTAVSLNDFSRYRSDVDPFYLLILALALTDLTDRVVRGARRLTSASSTPSAAATGTT